MQDGIEKSSGRVASKGSVPVAISYKTAPKENKSVRESNSLPSDCSGDM